MMTQGTLVYPFLAIPFSSEELHIPISTWASSTGLHNSPCNFQEHKRQGQWLLLSVRSGLGIVSLIYVIGTRLELRVRQQQLCTVDLTPDFFWFSLFSFSVLRQGFIWSGWFQTSQNQSEFQYSQGYIEKPFLKEKTNPLTKRQS